MEDVLIKIKKLLSMAPRDIWMRLGSEIGPYIDNLPPGEIEKKLSEKKTSLPFRSWDIWRVTFKIK